MTREKNKYKPLRYGHAVRMNDRKYSKQALGTRPEGRKGRADPTKRRRGSKETTDTMTK